MINLTFGEQVKIVLSRKDMTIKELAEEIEERTGKKMSRQNLTQRLGRDNFQEQDMRMIADILGCPFQLSILGNPDSEKMDGDEVPTGKELEKLAEKKERKAAREEAKKNVERDITVGEFVDMLEETDTQSTEPAEEEAVQMELSWDEAESVAEESSEAEEEQSEPEVSEMAENPEEVDWEEAEDILTEEAAEPYTETEEMVEISAEEAEALETDELKPEENAELETEPIESVESEEYQMEAEPVEQPLPEEQHLPEEEEKKHSPFSKITKLITPKKEKKSSGWPQDFQPIRRREDIDEDLVNGDVNPYTGHEYQSNSVRMHPHRIGYVQVYDRKDHKWTDMTEWAFLGVEERKKATMGKEYEPPIYLD